MSQFWVSHSESVLFIAIFAEQIGLPLPAAPLLMAAGALAAGGALSPATALAVSLAACVLPDSLWFCVGRRGGDGLLRFLSRLPLCDSASFGRTERLFAQYGMPAVAAAKFFPGLSLLMPPLAGAFRISFGRFLCFDALGSLLYAVFFLGLGFLFRDEVNGLLDVLNRFGIGTVVVASALIVIFVARKWAQRRKRAKPTPATVSRALVTVPG